MKIEFFSLVTLVVFVANPAMCDDKTKWVEHPNIKADAKTKQWNIRFELNRATDVEVAIVDATTSKVVRHLAAGVLGGNAPDPLQSGTLVQTISWDGRDDYGNPVADASKLVVRVRTGMDVVLDTIVGGDPYAFYSDEMGDSDHSPWGICGLEAKPDGNVYVWGHSSNLGPPALRQYDTDGNYRKTLFPMPAGNSIKSMNGWGIHVKPDGTYTPQFNLLIDPSLTTTFLDRNLRMARLMPSLETDRLNFRRAGLQGGAFDLMRMKTDGTIAEDTSGRLPGTLVQEPIILQGPVEPGSHYKNSLLGPTFVCPSADGKAYFISGVYAAVTIYGSVFELNMEGPWRDGQVWKVDAETRIAKPFFALEAQTIPVGKKERAMAFSGVNSYASLHGVAVDGDGHVFVCDRLNKRVLVLDENGKILREIEIDYPDAIAVSKRTGVVYVTSRFGDYHRRGAVHLHRIENWRENGAPTETLEISRTGYTRKNNHSYLAICESTDGTNVWVAHTQMPVRIYKDSGSGFKLQKDFFEVEGAQRCLGFDRMQVDPKTGDAFVLDSHSSVWKVSDWENPRFEKVPLETASIGIDPLRRHIYTRTQRDGSSSNSAGKIARFHLDKPENPPAFPGGAETNRITEQMIYEWCFEGNSDKGIAVAPNGNIAVVGNHKVGLRLFTGTEAKVPWSSTKIADIPAQAGGVRFDFSGNLYVGFADGKSAAKFPGFENDRHLRNMGRIYKFAPTGSLKSGNLFPKTPEEPAHVYDVSYGPFENRCVTRGPRFGVDGYGRISFPTNILPRVAIIDNAGNEILHFGTWGNRDSMGGMAGEKVPTKGIPLAFPNAVDATDDYVYVSDMVNLRLLRLKKIYDLDVVVRP
ncbi:MAG: hypothetical protein ACKVJU_25540 [Verrucomicrobiales bacterium]